jgi:pseudaminic acid biosynthesis-associated methylase
MGFRTKQEAFWAGNFGIEYIQRNQGDALLASNLNLFNQALRATRGIKSCIEFGANIGMNLRAVRLLYPGIDVDAVEINTEAARQLAESLSNAVVHNMSILEFKPVRQWDLALIKGVLIHINPDVLTEVYDKLVESCGRYILVVEYYNPVPVSIPYRGHIDRLFKRDFAGDMMELHPQLQLVDYGFVYHRDPNFPQDDISWFLMEKKQANTK